jgi:hypothetical protein
MSFEQCGVCSVESRRDLEQCPRCHVTKANVTKAADPAEVEVVKAVNSAMTTYTDIAKKANNLFQSGLEAFKAKNPGKGINAFMQTDEGAELRKHAEEARRLVDAGPVEQFTKKLDVEIAEIEKTRAAQVEDFSIAHNLDAKAAKKRLAEISPSFAALEKRWAAAHGERMTAVTKAREAAASWHRAEAVKAARAEHARAEKQQLARMKPSEQAFEARVAEIMKSRGLDRMHAITWGAANDEVLKSLRNVIDTERGIR